MATVVEIIGVTHKPFLPARLKNPDSDPALPGTQRSFDLMRAKLAAASPEVLVVVGNDHLNQTFTDNMPAFMVGKAPKAVGPFEHEIEQHSLSRYEASVDIELAKHLISDGFCKGVDFAFSEEFTMDHAFTVPLSFLRPEMDLPIVPVFPNCMALPLPPAERFYEVGLALRASIEEFPRNRRVGVVGTGHLSIEVGGPRMHGGTCDVEFDRRMTELIANADVPTLLREATYERMYRAGNVTSGFLAFVMLVGMARGAKPSHIEAIFSSSMATIPFMAWDLESKETQ